MLYSCCILCKRAATTGETRSTLVRKLIADSDREKQVLRVVLLCNERYILHFVVYENDKRKHCAAASYYTMWTRRIITLCTQCPASLPHSSSPRRRTDQPANWKTSTTEQTNLGGGSKENRNASISENCQASYTDS